MNAATLIEIKELCSHCHVHILDGEWERAQEFVNELDTLVDFDDSQAMIEWIHRVAVDLHMN